MVSAEFNGIPARLLADSGAGISVLSRGSAARLKLSLVPARLWVLHGVGGEAAAQLTTVNRFMVGDLAKDHVRFALASDLFNNVPGNLGQRIAGIQGQNILAWRILSTTLPTE